MLKVLGLDPSRSQALIDRGYDALWKIARTNEAELARIPEIGPIAARKVVASLHLLNYHPPARTKESFGQAEYECSLCGCVTSAFSTTCLECGAVLDEEEMDEDIRRSFIEGGDAALLAFFEGRLAEKPEDSALWYSHGLLLEALGRIDDAMASLDRSASTARDPRKIKVAQLRVQARYLRKPGVAEKLRSTASSLLDDVAWDQEVAQLDQLLAGAGSTCPECGASLPEGAAMCLSCGTRILPEAKRVPSPELDNLVDDLLVGELEESLSEEELELTKAAVLDWLIEELEESMAPEAEPAAPSEKPREEAVKGPSPISTSVGFLSGWMRGSRGLVSGTRTKREARGAGKVNGLASGPGRVNGLVNGVGRTNGLVNGLGRVNGLVQPAGRVNGLVAPRGRVNGLAAAQGRVNGIVNGTRFVRAGPRGFRLPTPSKRVRYLGIASGILVAILIAGLLFAPISGPSSRITIDGSFGDWVSVPMFDAASVASDANVSIQRYASLLDGNTLYLFASTRGGMFADATGYDGVDFLIDTDGNPSTGFAFNGIGADAVVEVFGGNTTLAGARLYTFPVDAEMNWSRRQASASVDAAASPQGLGLELGVSTFNLDRFDPAHFRIAVYADDFLGSTSHSLVSMSSAGGGILLDTRALTTVLGSGATNLFEIHARVVGAPPAAPWQVSNFRFNATSGVVVSLSPESINLTQGQTNATITASVSAPGFFPGQVVELSLTGAKSSDASVSVSIRSEPIRAYVAAPPARIQIDGLFADWISRDVPDTDPRPVRDSDLDIVKYGAATSNATAFFHVRVAGTLLGGGIPDRVLRSRASSGNGSSGGGTTILPRQTGEDLLLVYIETNASNPRGLIIGGISANYLVEVRGAGGRILAKSVYAWSNGWIRQPGISVKAAKNDTDIEASLPLPALNGTRMVIETTDWASSGDTTIPVPALWFLSLSYSGFGSTMPVAPDPNSFHGSTFYLRDLGPSITPSDCSAVKGLNTTKGTSGKNVTLTTGSQICFFTDPAGSAETITAGPWSASLDLSTTGTVLNVTFAITNQDGSSPSLICWSNRSSAGLDTLFSCSGGVVSILTGQRLRLRVQFISGSVTDLAYDGSDTAQDSSLVVHAPEFGDAAAPAITVAALVLLLSYRRRRREL
jgi:hypothetical protein